MGQPYTHEWYLKNRERLRRSHKKYYEKTKRRWSRYTKEWRKKNYARYYRTRRNWFLSNKERIYEVGRLCRSRNPQHYRAYAKKKLLQYKKKYPIRFALCKRLSIIRQRCKNPLYKDYPRYGGKGIKCLLTLREIEQLWYRDNAVGMKWASIDRINPNGNYTFRNCRFIEFTDNVSRASKRRWARFHG